MILFRAPWIYVILAFLVLITAWTALIMVATKNKAEAIPVAPANQNH
ncbi:MAG: hypothetical protein P1V20_11355 [Verrucomicrobiales bacterium]|nr:hypothetical protein [Verrucomicrobiales bacterium]